MVAERVACLRNAEGSPAATGPVLPFPRRPPAAGLGAVGHAALPAGRTAAAPPPGARTEGSLLAPGVLPLLPTAERRRVVAACRAALPIGEDTEPALAACLREVLARPGSLVRAQLAFAMGRGYGLAAVRARQLATAVELFHTASLLFDDLPAMDDAAERRGAACPHVVWGESTAILAALALVNRGYALLWQGFGSLPPVRRRAATDLVEACLGLAGLLSGQARDLAFARGSRSVGAVIDVAAGKSAPLLRLALELPALIAGASRAERQALGRLALAWGLAYQALDDFADRLAANGETGKTSDRDATLGRPNLLAVAGPAEALATVDDLLAAARRELALLAQSRSPRRGDRAQLLKTALPGLGSRVLATLEQGLERRRDVVRQRLVARA